MKNAATVSIENLNSEPYSSVVCYPRADPDEIQIRIKELHSLGVESVEFSGAATAFTLPVMGKGYVGIVAVAHIKGARYALKMQRIDSERESLEHEAELLKLANNVNVGPRFVAVSKRFLVMELIEGDLLEGWLQSNREKDSVKKVLEDILEQCWRLDEISLDHGELSKAPKHLLVNKVDKPFIVDFETASTKRNASNVTSVCQFLFQGNSNVVKEFAMIIGERNRPQLVGLLKNYRRKRTRDTFEDLLSACIT